MIFIWTNRVYCIYVRRTPSALARTHHIYTPISRRKKKIVDKFFAIVVVVVLRSAVQPILPKQPKQRNYNVIRMFHILCLLRCVCVGSILFRLNSQFTIEIEMEISSFGDAVIRIACRCDNEKCFFRSCWRLTVVCVIAMWDCHVSCVSNSNWLKFRWHMWGGGPRAEAMPPYHSKCFRQPKLVQRNTIWSRFASKRQCGGTQKIAIC